MIISDELIAESEQRLDFDPEAARQGLVDFRPLDHEDPERFKKRIAHVMKEAGDAAPIEYERILNNSDLMSINYFERGLIAALAVGRLLLRGTGGELLGYGTGFLVAPRLLMTNNHVLNGKDESRNSQIEFNYQINSAGKPLESHLFALQPDEFFYTNKDLDFSLVAVAEAAQNNQRALSQFGWLQLNAEVGKVARGEYLTIIQHPNGEYKQIAIRENQLLKIADQHLWYKTDTAPGSSGSPVFNDLWQVVALHHSGVPDRDRNGNYLTIDGKIWTDQMDETKIKWLANEGVRVSRIVENIKQARPDHPLIRAMLDNRWSALPVIVTQQATTEGRGEVGGGEPSVSSAKSEAPTPTTLGGFITTMNVPLTIAVSIGGLTPAVRVEAGAQPAATEAISIDPNYASRQGYSVTFLGAGSKRVPLPVLSAAMKKNAAENTQATGANRYVLPYHHFSVVMNKVRKIAYVTAVNIDGSLSHDIKRETDQWFFDPRIDRAWQAGPEVYDNNPLDKGHLVRRLDPAWGTTEDLAKVANDDTFHYTNCSPQHQDFNRNQTLWAGLENYILEHAIAENLKVSVFTGPVCDDTDRQYRGVKLPKQFWKVVVMVKHDTGKLSATAYLLSQSQLLDNLGAEVFSYGAYKTYQVPVRRIESLTGLKFGKLRSFDPLEAPTAAPESVGFREIVTHDDLSF